MHGFTGLVGDRNWRATIEQAVPVRDRAGRQGRRDLLRERLTGPTWTFGPQQAAAITCPVLSVLGSNSSPLFVEGRQLLHAWFPACQDAAIVGATHLLQMQAPGPVAARSPPSCDGAVYAPPGRRAASDACRSSQKVLGWA